MNAQHTPTDSAPATKPTYHAYLRVSTDEQDVRNQKHGILEYANEHHFSGLKFTEDSASGKTSWRTRKLGELIDGLQHGDVLIFAEISRIARSTLQVLEISRECIERGVSLHVAKNGIVFDDTMQSKIVATVLGLVAEIERDFISARTKEALAKRKAEGVKLGRPTGPAKTMRLDKYADKIDDYLAKKIDKRAIAKLLDVSPNTLYAWLKARRPDAVGPTPPTDSIPS